MTLFAAIPRFARIVGRLAMKRVKVGEAATLVYARHPFMYYLFTLDGEHYVARMLKAFYKGKRVAVVTLLAPLHSFPTDLPDELVVTETNKRLGEVPFSVAESQILPWPVATDEQYARRVYDGWRGRDSSPQVLVAVPLSRKAWERGDVLCV